MNRVKSGVFDPLFEVKDLHLFRKGLHTMLGQVLVEVVLFIVLVDEGVKSETTAFRIEPVGLEVLDD
jgi:hypothetical protein